MFKTLLVVNYFLSGAIAQQFLKTDKPSLTYELEEVNSVETTHFSDDYSATFSAENCSLTLIHKPSQTEIYSADARDIVKTGRSNIDNETTKIIVDGNIAKEPKVPKLSQGHVCPTYASLSMGSPDSPINIVQLDGEQKINLGGWFSPDKRTVATRVRMSLAEDGVGVVIEASIFDDKNEYDIITVNYNSPKDEEIYGLGLQYTEWNFRGKQMPIITAEAGVGRGLQTVTFFINLFFSTGSGGTPLQSYSPSRSYVTNKNRGVTFNSTAIGYYDFQDQTSASFWHEKTVHQTVFYGESIKQLGAMHSKKIGTMRALPEWIMNGAIVALQGGQKVINETSEKLIKANVPIVAFWMQDWVGLANYSEGQRLMWNWQLNRQHYPQWDETVKHWAGLNIKPLIYINPYFQNISDKLANTSETDQFKEAYENKYFIKNQDNSPQLMKSFSMEFGCIDLTNPDGRKWIKDIIKKNMIDEAGAWGWMHDFGEYVTLDSKTYDGSDPIQKNHNDFPRLWAEIVEEAIAESNAPHMDEIVYFMRSGSTSSPKHTRLFWMGDQLPTFDQYDGLWSAIIGQLNGGISGFTLGHSDIGGYTTINQVDGLYHYYRSKELLLRWIESSTFSDMIMRTHIGLLPQYMYQVWDDPETIQFFGNFAGIHKSLKDYKLGLMKENEKSGVAPLRSLLVEFESDPNVKKIKDQFMLGSDLMMAPILKAGHTRRSVYMPQGTWKHYFTKEIYDYSSGGAWLKFQHAPLGQPLVFVKDDLSDKILQQDLKEQELKLHENHINEESM